MRQYNGAAWEDHLLMTWWIQMLQSGELGATLGARFEAAGEFFAAFRPPSRLLYEFEDGTVKVACWFDPSPLAGSFFSLWLHPSWRRTKRGFRAILEAMGVGFGEYQNPVLLFVTAQPEIARLHAHFGATVLGAIPHLYDGERDAFVSYLTREQFAAITAKHEQAA